MRLDKTDLFTAGLLLVVCVVAMVVGFLLAMGGLPSAVENRIARRQM